MKFENNRIYDVLKWIVITFLPALMAFLNVVLPAVSCPDQIVRVIGIVLPAFTAFLGALLGVGSIQYKKDQEGK